MKKRRRMEATGHQNRRTNEDDGDHESLGKVALFYAQCAENHQPDHNGLEKKAAAQSRLAKRRDYEDENDQGDSDESKAQVARPELGHMLVKNRSWSLIHIIRHEEHPPAISGEPLPACVRCGDSGRTEAQSSTSFFRVKAGAKIVCVKGSPLQPFCDTGTRCHVVHNRAIAFATLLGANLKTGRSDVF